MSDSLRQAAEAAEEFIYLKWPAGGEGDPARDAVLRTLRSALAASEPEPGEWPEFEELPRVTESDGPIRRAAHFVALSHDAYARARRCVNREAAAEALAEAATELSVHWVHVDPDTPGARLLKALTTFREKA